MLKFADREERGKLAKGDDGFLDAALSDGTVEKTEQPNALLAAKAAAAQAKETEAKKGKPAARAMRKIQPLAVKNQQQPNRNPG